MQKVLQGNQRQALRVSQEGIVVCGARRGARRYDERRSEAEDTGACGPLATFRVPEGSVSGMCSVVTLFVDKKKVESLWLKAKAKPHASLT
jgi:hypothetical protein